MKRYIASIPKPWASFRFDCNNRQSAISLFNDSARSAEVQFAHLYLGRKDNGTVVAYIADGKLFIVDN